MRVALVLCVVAAAAAGESALAAPPALSVRAGATAGPAPLGVTLTATGDAVSYSWDLGDGTFAQGASVTHTYARARRYRAVVSAASATGEVTRASVEVTAFRLFLSVPGRAAYGARRGLRGHVQPAVARRPVTLLRAGRPVTTVRTRPDGSFRFVTRLGEPGPYRARSLNVFSEPRAVVIRPGLEAVLDGSPTVGSPLRLVARVLPARAGALRVTVLRDGERTYRATYRGAVRLRLGTGRPGRLRIRLSLEPARRFLPASRVLSTAVVEPRLALGSSGPSVAALEERLAELHYALRGIDGAFGLDTYEAILAFQKVHGLARTGRVDGSLWRALAGSGVPTARYGGDHIEVSKGRQVLYVVRGGQVTAVVHVSTGATGNTPLGRWRIYRKSAGWDWVLWYPLYFLRGFAIHGYPSVPAYPASHGCVRVPMWIAPRLFADNPYGGAVYVYS